MSKNNGAFSFKLTFLGTGTSIGIPVPACRCPVCRSLSPRNRRSRCSALLEAAGRHILIDTSPEFRLQALKNRIHKLDAVLWTHAHADHLHGLDDLRAFSWKHPVEGYTSENTAREIKERFSYLWKVTQKGGGKAQVNLNAVPPCRPFTAENLSPLEIIPVPLIHGRLPIYGWRCGPVAYLTDLSQIPPESYPLLQNLKILVLGALRFKPHPTHLNIERALEEIKKIRPEKAYLTHISHEASHRQIRRALPPNVLPAFDGLVVRTSGELFSRH